MSSSNSENSIASVLGEIHQIQRQLSDLSSRLRMGQRTIQTQMVVAQQITTRLEQTRAEHRQIAQIAKTKESQLAQSEAALKRRREQMQEAKNNKEYLALQMQIQADEAANAVLADEAFEAMEKVENFAPKIEAVEKELQQVENQLKKLEENITKEQPVIEVDQARCSERLKTAELKLPREFKEIYTRLARSMGGEQALAAITNQEFCGGCRQLIPISFVAQIVQGKPVTCKSCGRLLYAPEGFSIK